MHGTLTCLFIFQIFFGDQAAPISRFYSGVKQENGRGSIPEIFFEKSISKLRSHAYLRDIQKILAKNIEKCRSSSIFTDAD